MSTQATLWDSETSGLVIGITKYFGAFNCLPILLKSINQHALNVQYVTEHTITTVRSR